MTGRTNLSLPSDNLDASRMVDLLSGFPDQCREAIRIGRRAQVTLPRKKKPAHIIVTGLGGSAIGGDLLRGYLQRQCGIPVLVNRGYDLPAFVGKDTVVFVTSYSGNTEETLSSFHDARRKKARIVSITSGGKLELLSCSSQIPVVRIPTGYPPRAALGYSFFPMLVLLESWGLVPSQRHPLRETLDLLTCEARRYRPQFRTAGNLARTMAEHLMGVFPIIYSSDHLEAVATRFRNQLNENSKILAHSHVLPELDHNEIVGWEVQKRLMQGSVVVFLRDRDEHPRVCTRFEITRDLLGRQPREILEVTSEGKSLLARTFSLIHLADWVSYYLALLNRVDPTPVKKIGSLKECLARHR